jgi:hypothetical protein
MKYDAFISYSTTDKLTADAIVNYLESNGLRCWYAPRDIQAGMPWPMAISQALKSSHAMVLLFSEASNLSKQVAREITLADNSPDLVLIPFRLSAVDPSEQMDYYLANTHWLDAVSQEPDQAYNALREALCGIVEMHGDAQPQSGNTKQASPATKAHDDAPLSSESLKTKKFRLEVREALEDGTIDSVELKILEKIRDLCGLDEDAANAIIEEEKCQLQTDLSGEPDNATFRRQVCLHVKAGRLTEDALAELKTIQSHCNLGDADAIKIIEEEQALAAESKFRSEVRETLEAGAPPGVAQNFLELLQAELGINQAVAEQIYKEEAELQKASQPLQEQTDGDGSGDNLVTFLTARDLAEALSMTFSEEECDQLRSALGVSHKSGTISTQMVDALLFSMGYLETDDDGTWRCSELGKAFCHKVVDGSSTQEQKYQSWNSLVLEDIEQAIRERIKENDSTSPLCEEMELIIQSFTPARQNFVRALIESGLAKEPTITQDQILTIVEQHPGLEFPDWLVNPKISPEYTHEEPGRFLSPLMVSNAVENTGESKLEEDLDLDNGDESLQSQTGLFSRTQMRFINALKKAGLANQATLTRKEIDVLVEKTEGLNFPHWATREPYKTGTRGIFRNPMHPVFTSIQQRFVDILDSRGLRSSLTRPMIQEIVDETPGLKFPYWVTYEPYKTNKRGHFHNPLIPLEC